MPDNLHLEILPKRQKILFDCLSKLEWLKDFYLAGGTALALQIAHRQSIDFDFFTEKEFDTRRIKNKLISFGNFELFSESEQILDGRISSIRISFFNFVYPLIKQTKSFCHMRIISREDIAAMKLAAISSRGSRKDFIDFYFLLKEFSLSEIVGFFEKKYGKNKENLYCALKGLIYFNDAERHPMPNMLKSVSWKEIKKYLTQMHKEYIGKLK